jgi:hypothetical protein
MPGMRRSSIYTPRMIADMVGVSIRTARRWLVESGAAMRRPGSAGKRQAHIYTTPARLLAVWPDLLMQLRESEQSATDGQ